MNTLPDDWRERFQGSALRRQRLAVAWHHAGQTRFITGRADRIAEMHGQECIAMELDGAVGPELHFIPTAAVRVILPL